MTISSNAVPLPENVYEFLRRPINDVWAKPMALAMPRVSLGQPFGHSHRIADTYRSKALVKVFAHLRGKVLDFGCGSKPYQKALQHESISEWVGVDLPLRTSGPAQKNCADVYFAADGTVPLGDARFDVILSTQVLEHVPDLSLSLRELSRLLHEDGVAILTCPMTSVLHETPHDYRRFTPYGLALDAHKEGLRLALTVALGGPYGTMASLLAQHLNPLLSIPLVGKVAHGLLVEIICHSALTLERLLFRLGYKQCLICCDYLFVLTKLTKDSASSQSS